MREARTRDVLPNRRVLSPLRQIVHAYIPLTQIFLQDVHVLPKLLNYDEHYRRVRCDTHGRKREVLFFYFAIFFSVSKVGSKLNLIELACLLLYIFPNKLTNFIKNIIQTTNDVRTATRELVGCFVRSSSIGLIQAEALRPHLFSVNKNMLIRDSLIRAHHYVVLLSLCAIPQNS
jgi:hypothetical protein